MANALAGTGVMFPFFAPLLGWLGVFITGSDTSANALFGKLQSTTASSIGVDPVVTVGANVSGGVVGKMISPQSIAVAAGAGGLIGRESELFRFTVKHSFIMLLFISLLVLAQAYVFTWLIPEYTASAGEQAHAASGGSAGYLYLGIVAAVVLVIALLVASTRKHR
ncbi:L-lactate permease [Parapedobacter koreensis]|uniref:L-lactate permease n=1 Tax=Parapedobacter koreensis TaxID=332977 RepID=A0A1H7UHW2_9SPHI|nr:L-lactate permease [Parapedobacter koreensis]SEL96650.1 lactate permease [Parapedobacter koreensis]